MRMVTLEADGTLEYGEPDGSHCVVQAPRGEWPAANC